MLGLPVFFLPRVTLDAFTLPKFAFVSAALALALAWDLWAPGSLSWHHARPLVFPAVAISLPLVISWSLSPYRAWSLLGQYTRMEGLLPYLVAVLLGVMLAAAFRSDLVALARLIVSAGAVVAAYALAQALGIEPTGQPLLTYVYSTMGNSNFLGGFLAITLPLSVGLWVERGWHPALSIVTTSLIGFGILISFSQGAWLAAAAGASVVAGAMLSKRRLGGIIAVGVPLLTVAISLVAVLYASLFPFGSLTDSGNRSRSLWWSSAVAMGFDSPLIGRGPNSFAMEHVRYRPPLDSLDMGAQVVEAPHSVPLSFFAGAGLLGLGGFCAAAGWALKRTIERWRRRTSLLAIAFGAGVVAYLVQSLVSIDHFTLAAVFWVCLAGLGEDRSSAKTRPAPRRAVLSRVTAVAVLGVGLWSAITLLRADIAASTGVEAFRAGDVELGRQHLRAAIDIRDEYGYRQVFGFHLGAAAVRAGESGRELMEEMDEVTRPLMRYPKLSGRIVRAGGLHQWSAFDPSLDEEALDIYLDTLTFDRHNPVLTLYASDILLRADRFMEAGALIEDMIAIVRRYPQYKYRYAELWANLSVAQLGAGNDIGATDSLTTALELGGEEAEQRSCRIALASEIHRQNGLPEPAPAVPGGQLRFLCTPAQLRLLSNAL